MPFEKKNRKTLWLLFALAFGMAVGVVLVPFLLIQPFKAQTPDRVAISFILRRWSPVITIILFLLALALHWRLWSGSRWFKRTLTSIALFLIAGVVWFSQQNYFEWFFNPLPNPRYASASQSGFLLDTDMVLAVNLNNDRVAYPVRLLAYHHLVQDAVGGVPVLATY